MDRSWDPAWWALAVALCLGVISLPRAFRLEASDSLGVLVQLGLFFSGALMGSLRPHRVWRWPVASFLAFGFADLTRMANNPKFNLSSADELWSYLAHNASVYALHTLPVLLGAYFGRYLSTEGAN